MNITKDVTIKLTEKEISQIVICQLQKDGKLQSNIPVENISFGTDASGFNIELTIKETQK